VCAGRDEIIPRFVETRSTAVSEYLTVTGPSVHLEKEDVRKFKTEEEVDMMVEDPTARHMKLRSMPLKSAVGSSKINTPTRSDIGLSKLPRAQKRSEADTPFRSRMEKMNDVSP
jgi:hypothetical protein